MSTKTSEGYMKSKDKIKFQIYLTSQRRLYIYRYILQDTELIWENFSDSLDLIEVHFYADFTELYQSLKMEEVVMYMVASLVSFPRSTPMPITYINLVELFEVKYLNLTSL